MTVVALLLCLCFGVAQAGVVGDMWNDLKVQSDLHLGDNVQPASFYNFNGKSEAGVMAGFMTCVYSYRAFEAQLGGIKAIDSNAPFTPAIGAAIRTEKYIAKVLPFLTKIVGKDNIDPLSRLRVGPFFSYDFQKRAPLYGIQGSLSFNVNPEGQ